MAEPTSISRPCGNRLRASRRCCATSSSRPRSRWSSRCARCSRSAGERSTPPAAAIRTTPGWRAKWPFARFCRLPAALRRRRCRSRRYRRRTWRRRAAGLVRHAPISGEVAPHDRESRGAGALGAGLGQPCCPELGRMTGGITLEAPSRNAAGRRVAGARSPRWAGRRASARTRSSWSACCCAPYGLENCGRF